MRCHEFHVKPRHDDELLQRPREIRLTRLAIGFESASQKSLHHECKGTPLAT